MIAHRAKPSALGAFDQTLLFQRPMIHLDAPRRECEVFPLRFGHLVEIRRPVFRCAVCGKNAKHFDFSEAFEPRYRAVAARPRRLAVFRRQL